MRPVRPITRRTSGFTLLEVLLAFVVFALSFAVVLEILSGSIRNTVRAREYTEAALIAQSVMDQVGLEIPLVAGANASGEAGPYRWDLEIVPFIGTENEARLLELSEMTGLELLEVLFEIRWGEGSRERMAEFSTVRAVLPETEAGIRL